MAELNQFCILASKQKGRACAALIQQVISNKKIHNFGELLSMSSVKQLNDKDSEYISYYKTLELFAYGKYSDYINNKDVFLELNDNQIFKLKQLSIVSLAEKDRDITYELLQNELDINDIRILEDLIIDTIYAGLIKGKLNQSNKILRIIDTIRRDVNPNQLGEIITYLQIWQENVSTLIQTIETSSYIVRNSREECKYELENTQKSVDNTKAKLKERSEGGMGLSMGMGIGIGNIMNIAYGASKSSRSRGRGIGRDRE